jgi:hypothetical protein
MQATFNLTNKTKTNTPQPPPKRTKQINKVPVMSRMINRGMKMNPLFSNSDDEEAYDNIVVQRNDESPSEETPLM